MRRQEFDPVADRVRRIAPARNPAPPDYRPRAGMVAADGLKKICLTVLTVRHGAIAM